MILCWTPIKVGFLCKIYFKKTYTWARVAGVGCETLPKHCCGWQDKSVLLVAQARKLIHWSLLCPPLPHWIHQQTLFGFQNISITLLPLTTFTVIMLVFTAIAPLLASLLLPLPSVVHSHNEVILLKHGSVHCQWSVENFCLLI